MTTKVQLRSMNPMEAGAAADELGSVLTEPESSPRIERRRMDQVVGQIGSRDWDRAKARVLTVPVEPRAGGEVPHVLEVEPRQRVLELGVERQAATGRGEY